MGNSRQQDGTSIALFPSVEEESMAATAQAAFNQQMVGSQRKGQKKDWAPTAKVSAGVLAGATTILLTAFLSPHWRNWTQQDMTPAIGAALTNILTFAIQYLVPERK